jgi:coenzyme F420-0:L-glutamate ligase/coenzyme F420-1:gamma-L-glutamate ligase
VAGKTLTLTPLPDIPLIVPGDDLVAIILDGLRRLNLLLQDGDVIVIAQKIVSKAEGRFVNLEEVQPSAEAQALATATNRDPRFVELILQESSRVIRTGPGVIIVEHRLGFVCASAGIDHSNVIHGSNKSGEWVLLLPDDPDGSARSLQIGLQAASRARIGVAIIDSHGRAWRLGTVGITIGLAGLPGLVDLRGEPDLFGYELQITQVGAVDELAAGASLVMGQTDEAVPVVHVRGFPYPLREACLGELLRARNEDLFR